MIFIKRKLSDSLVIRQKGEPQNGNYKKTKHVKITGY